MQGIGFLNYKLRKIIHYALIMCILIIQVVLAAFIYTEFKNRKDLAFIENQLKEVSGLEHFTHTSNNNLLEAQNSFRKYALTKDPLDLSVYFDAIKKLNKNIDSLNSYKFRNPELKSIFKSNKSDLSNVDRMKTVIDSTERVITRSIIPPNKIFNPEIKPFQFDYDFHDLDVKTEVFKDTIKKKGLFGRLKDAVVGKETVRKDSTVVTLNHAKKENSVKAKKLIDSLISQAQKYYSTEVKRVQVNVVKTQKINEDRGSSDVSNLALFDNLLTSSSNLMSFYDSSIKSSKSNLENELLNLKSKKDKVRMNFAIGAMILMFIVSMLIMYFTRLAFFYERKLSIADERNKANLSFKNRILGMLSHELRSPLKIVDIFINRINKKTDDEKIKEYLKLISYTNNSLLMQSNQILEYTKNQQVQNKLAPVVFNLKNEITSFINSVEPYLETRNNKFIVNENIDSSINVFSDSTKMNQVFMNIVVNANKFTENGQISLSTKTEKIDENQVCLITEIKDSGAGISESDLKNIFEPYYQGVLSGDVENLGAGLGLSLCKEIVELFSGEISVTSEINKGTNVKFVLVLPLKNNLND